MPIVHIVLFQFLPSATPTAIQDVCTRLLALRSQCLHPTTRAPYLKTAVGGKDHSPEGLQGGLTHGFVIEFADEADRDYYVTEDPAHRAFVKTLEGVVEKATVVDFTPGGW